MVRRAVRVRVDQHTVKRVGRSLSNDKPFKGFLGTPCRDQAFGLRANLAETLQPHSSTR